MLKKLRKKGMAVVTAAAMMLGLLPAVASPAKVEAATTKRGVNLGTSVLTSVEKVQYNSTRNTFKEIGGEGWTSETGQRIYFGSYNGTDTAYRVLMNDGQKILLDCDSFLYQTVFDNNSEDNPQCSWADSTLRADLNSKYKNYTLLSAEETPAVLQATLSVEHTSLEYGADPETSYIDYATSDYIFVLSAQEVLDYYTRDGQMKDIDYSSWTRTTMVYSGKFYVGILAENNPLVIRITYAKQSSEYYVSPAFYLDSSKVLFTTAASLPVNTAFTAVTASDAKDWRLTLKDSSKKLTLGAIARNGNHVTVPYSYSGTSANQITAMITDKAYTDASAQVLYYGKVSGTGGVSANGSVTFDLPSNLPAGYHLYLMAEQANGTTKTAFSSVPTEVLSISTVDLTGLDAPQPAVALDSTAECKTTGVATRSPQVTWSPADATAQYDAVYQASVTLYPAAGYMFGDSVTATFDGASAAKIGATATTTANADGSITVTITFPKVGTLVKGCEYTDTASKGVYTVTKLGSKNGTVEYTRPTDSAGSTITIPKTVKIGGVSYKVTSIAKNAFKNNKTITKVTIGNNILTIGTNAFYGCTKLKTVIMGANVTTIKAKAFYQCTALTKIVFPNSLKIIGKQAFYGCTKLKTVTMGTGVTTIRAKAFYKCTALTKITLPSKVKRIGKQAFYGCKKLKTITVKTTKLTSKKIGKQVFKGIYTKATVKLPAKKYATYKKLFKKKGVGSKATFKKVS